MGLRKYQDPAIPAAANAGGLSASILALEVGHIFSATE